MFFLEYETPKIIKIRNWQLALINKTIQISILIYVIGYVLLYKKGYQSFDQLPMCANSIKIKGIGSLSSAYTKTNDSESIVDMVDYQFTPPVDNNAFYIPTRLIITENQIQSQCPEDPNIPSVFCILHSRNNSCQNGQIIEGGNGIQTGRCVKFISKDINLNGKETNGVCEIKAWCPVQLTGLHENKSGDSESRLIIGAENFTIFIKNSITFSKFGVKRRNIMDNFSWEPDRPIPPPNPLKYLRTCKYSPESQNWFCPVFTLNDLLNYSNSTYQQVYSQGAIIAVKIDWKCNLDRDLNKCIPSYSFSRIDDPKVNYSPGWNFKYAQYFKENTTMKRTLIKVFGIRFMIFSTGSAGKFNFIPLMINMGSGLALMGFTSVICDILILYLMKNKDIYKAKKYEQLETHLSDSELIS
ncbi:unnamed protein product [Gordionus sp. m RMFG-2023]